MHPKCCLFLLAVCKFGQQVEKISLLGVMEYGATWTYITYSGSLCFYYGMNDLWMESYPVTIKLIPLALSLSWSWQALTTSIQLSFSSLSRTILPPIAPSSSCEELIRPNQFLHRPKPDSYFSPHLAYPSTSGRLILHQEAQSRPRSSLRRSLWEWFSFFYPGYKLGIS